MTTETTYSQLALKKAFDAGIKFRDNYHRAIIYMSDIKEVEEETNKAFDMLIESLQPSNKN